MSLLKEYLYYILTEAEVVPDAAKGLFPGKFGLYYRDAQLTQYAGKVVNGKWVPAKAISPTEPRATPSTEEEPTTSRNVQPDIESDPTQITPVAGEEPEKTSQEEIPTEPKSSKSDETVVNKPPRAVEVMGDIFTESREITRGDTIMYVRHIFDKETNDIVDVSTPEGRFRAVAILDAHIQTLDSNIKSKANRMNQRISKTERQQLRKWIGNVGEVCGLRDLLASDLETYLYADSFPKNDIAIVFTYDGGEEVDVRQSIVVGVSTKTSTGTKSGRKESSSLPFVMESVEGKTIQVQLPTGQTEDFDADDAATALYAVHNLLFVSCTRGFIVRGTNPNFKEERTFNVKDSDLPKFDRASLQIAIDQQKAAAARLESGGQKQFVEARKLMPSDVDTTFDKESSAYKRIVNKVVRNMQKGKTPEAIAQAEKLVDNYVSKLRQEVLQGSIDIKGRGYRLSDVNTFLKNGVAELLQSTNSPFIFQSDLMTVSFDSTVGYIGMTIVPSEVMKTRMEERYGKFEELSVIEQLDLSGWEINTRGMGLSSAKGGYLGPLPRVSPQMELLKKEKDEKGVSDFLTAPQFKQFVEELHRREKLRKLEEYLWR